MQLRRKLAMEFWLTSKARKCFCCRLFVKMTGGDRVEYGAAASGGAKQQQQQADVASTSTSGQPQQPPVHETT